MTETNATHWDHTICPETLAALSYSRTGVLTQLGFHRQAARMFSLLEQERRQALVREIGADTALLASVEWKLFDRSFACRVVPLSLPIGLGDRFFEGSV